MAEHNLPDLDGDGEDDSSVDATDPIELVEVIPTSPIEPPEGWLAEAHAEEYADDPAVVIDLTGDDTPEAA